MDKIGILVDSTTHTSEELFQYDFVKTAYLKVVIDEKEYKENELTSKDMEAYIEAHTKMKTSQPAPTDFLDLYNEFQAEGYTHVLVVILSHQLSGTFQSAMLAKTMFETDMEISVHSPEAASFGIANGLRVVAKDVEAKKSFDDVLKHYHALFAKPSILFTLENLKHLFVGGRLSRIQALIGTVLRIKPIVEMVDGKLKMVKKERTNAACLAFFLENIDQYVNEFKNVYVDVIHLNMDKWAEKLVQAIEEKYDNVHIHVTEKVSPVFYVHLGNKGFGVSVLGTN